VRILEVCHHIFVTLPPPSTYVPLITLKLITWSLESLAACCYCNNRTFYKTRNDVLLHEGFVRHLQCALIPLTIRHTHRAIIRAATSLTTVLISHPNGVDDSLPRRSFSNTHILLLCHLHCILSPSIPYWVRPSTSYKAKKQLSDLHIQDVWSNALELHGLYIASTRRIPGRINHPGRNSAISRP
jgi:hypothetical protein